MKYFTVKQIKIPASEKDYPNQYGWSGAEEKSPAWKAKMQTMHYRDSFEIDPSALEFYKDTYLVQANDLEHVFKITNLWDEPDAVHSYETGHSTSVGDIVMDNETGDQFMVANFGFKKVA